MKSLCIYCGSKVGDNPSYLQSAQNLGAAAAKRGWRIVYGGGKLGLMGATAGAARDAGGDVFGVIPKFHVDQEGILEGVEHKIVQTMHERKMLMFEKSDAVIALPGGPGTLDELMEVLTWRQLGLHGRPVVLVNPAGYWDPLLTLLDNVVESGFADRSFLGYLSVVRRSTSAVDQMERLLEG